MVLYPLGSSAPCGPTLTVFDPGVSGTEDFHSALQSPYLIYLYIFVSRYSFAGPLAIGDLTVVDA